MNDLGVPVTLECTVEFFTHTHTLSLSLIVDQKAAGALFFLVKLEGALCFLEMLWQKPVRQISFLPFKEILPMTS